MSKLYDIVANNANNRRLAEHYDVPDRRRHVSMLSKTYVCEGHEHVKRFVDYVIDLSSRTYHTPTIVIEGLRVTVSSTTPGVGEPTELDREFINEVTSMFGELL